MVPSLNSLRLNLSSYTCCGTLALGHLLWDLDSYNHFETYLINKIDRSWWWVVWVGSGNEGGKGVRRNFQVSVLCKWLAWYLSRRSGMHRKPPAKEIMICVKIHKECIRHKNKQITTSNKLWMSVHYKVYVLLTYKVSMDSNPGSATYYLSHLRQNTSSYYSLFYPFLSVKWTS